MIWLIVVAVLAGIAVLPLGISAVYDSTGASVKLIAGPLRFLLYPGKKKQKKEKEDQPQEQTPAQGGQSQSSGGGVKDFMPLVQVVLDFLAEFRSKLRVDVLELKLTLAGDDPCDLAVNYGRAWAALGNLVPQLERFFVIKKRDMQVQCDFTADTTVIYARLDLTLAVARILSLGLRHGFKAVREYLKIMKSRKGGALQ